MPLTSIQQIFDQVPVFVLVLFRLAGMVALAPLLGSTAIPVKIRLMLVLMLSFAVFPLVKPVRSKSRRQLSTPRTTAAKKPSGSK